MKPILWLALPLLFASACGYHIANRSEAPPDIRTIAIPVFANQSGEPELHRDLTRAIQRAFMADGRLKLAAKDRADLVMKGELNHYGQKAASFDTSDVVLEYWVELGVTVEVLDRAGKPYTMKERHRVKWDYRTDPDLTLSEIARKAALENAYRELGNRLVSLVIEQF